MPIMNNDIFFSFFNKYKKIVKLKKRNKTDSEKLFAKIRNLYFDARKDVIKPESNDNDENPPIDLNIL